jgi:hypothetical protein
VGQGRGVQGHQGIDALLNCELSKHAIIWRTGSFFPLLFDRVLSWRSARINLEAKNGPSVWWCSSRPYLLFDRLSIGLYMNFFERTMEEKNYLTQMGIFSGRLVTDAHSNRHLFTHTGGLPSCTSS